MWGIFIVLTFYLVKDDVLASIFVSIFILNLTSEKLINIFTINERLNKDDSTYIKFHNLKNIFMEIIVPSIFIFNIQNFQKWSNFPTLFLIICLFVIVLITIYAYKQEAKPKFMRISFFSGIVYKKIDGLFIRLFTGYFWGFTALGTIQPAMSIARSIGILTPLWINLNLNHFFSSYINKSSIKAFFWIPASYIVYVLLSLIAFQLLKLFSVNEFSQVTLTLAFIWFGNSNTKAIIRAIAVFNSLLIRNNTSLVISIIFKFVLAFFIMEGDFFNLFILLILIDFVHICIFVFILTREAKKQIE